MLLASASGNGNFYFADTEVIVSEKRLTQAVFGITRAGDSSGSAVLTCMVGTKTLLVPFIYLNCTLVPPGRQTLFYVSNTRRCHFEGCGFQISLMSF